MKTSEKIVHYELMLFLGLGMAAIGKGYLILCDRVTKLERQQVNQIEQLTQMAKKVYRIKEKK